MPTAASTKLCTLDVAKTQLKISGVSPDDTLIDRYISIASLWIEGQCGREFKSQTYTDEIYDGSGEDLLYVRHAPVTVVTAIAYRDANIWTAEPFEASDLAYYDRDEQGEIWWIDGSYWPRGRNNVRLTYAAGYNPIPFDLQHGCALLVQSVWHKRENMTEMMPQVVTVDGVTQFFKDKVIPDFTRDVIRKYRLYL